MSDWPRVIEDAAGAEISVKPFSKSVRVTISLIAGESSVYLTVEASAALIAAITDAAKVVTGEGK